MPVNDQSAAITYNPLTTYPAGTIGAALQAGAIGAPINSPTFTGDPRAPTAAPGDNDTSIATTAFVTNAVTAVSVPNGDKGDITVSGSGLTWTIDPQAVTLAKLVNATAQYRLLMRTTAGAGSFEEVQGSADVANFLTATNFSNMRTKLSLGALSTQSLVDNADWDAAGLALAVTNGGTGAKTVPLGRIGLSGSWTTLTDGATINTDCSVNDRFTVTLAGTPRTLANPSGIIDGADYRWRFIQDATGGRPLTLGTAFNFAAGSAPFAISSAASSVSYLSGIGRGAKIDVVATVGFPRLMFIAPFTFQSGVAGALVAPVMSSRTVLMRTDATAWGDSDLPPLAFPYTSASGNVFYLGCARSNASVTRTLVADWNGDATLSLTTAKQDGSNNLSCQAAIKTGGFVGAGDFHVISDSAVPRFVYFLGWALDLDQVRGGIGAAASTVIAVTQSFVEVSLVVTQPGSLLVAAGWNQLSNSQPFTWPAGWTKLDEQNIATGNQPCGSIATKIATAAGPELVTMTGDQATGQWAIIAVEFPPG